MSINIIFKCFMDPTVVGNGLLMKNLKEWHLIDKTCWYEQNIFLLLIANQAQRWQKAWMGFRWWLFFRVVVYFFFFFMFIHTYKSVLKRKFLPTATSKYQKSVGGFKLRLRLQNYQCNGGRIWPRRIENVFDTEWLHYKMEHSTWIVHFCPDHQSDQHHSNIVDLQKRDPNCGSWQNHYFGSNWCQVS